MQDIISILSLLVAIVAILRVSLKALFFGLA